MLLQQIQTNQVYHIKRSQVPPSGYVHINQSESILPEFFPIHIHFNSVQSLSRTLCDPMNQYSILKMY